MKTRVTKRAARVKALLKRPFFDGVTDKQIIDPAYDLLALRRRERPAQRTTRTARPI
jgi:hypothetical protein